MARRRMVGYPAGSTALPLVQGWRGLVVVREEDTRALTEGWECPHVHYFKDTAEHCAGMAHRRWLRTGDPSYD